MGALEHSPAAPIVETMHNLSRPFVPFPASVPGNVTKDSIMDSEDEVEEVDDIICASLVNVQDELAAYGRPQADPYYK